MFRLRLLGSLTLEIEPGQLTGRATQKRRLALLSVLATRPGVPVTRDKLLGLFWPEVATEEARHRLSAALYDLRRALGEAALLTRGDEVWITPGALECDVVEFETALDAHDWPRAARLYRGPFLDGVHIENAAEFEEWADQRRTALARAYSRSLEEWAAECTARGDFGTAAEVWQRVADAEPLSDRIALGLMKALEAAGNRAAAVRHATIHEARLRTELGVRPDASVRDFMAAVRAAYDAPRELAASDAAIEPAALVVNSSAAVGDVSSSALTRTPPRAWAIRAALLAGLLVLPAALRILPQRGAQADAASGGSPALGAFREGAAHLQSGRFEAAVSAFERAVNSDSTFAPAHFQLAVATLWADQPGDKIDARVRRALAHRDQLDALNRTLLDGFSAWRRGQWSDAEGVYRRALILDPTSIQARHELGEVLFHYNAPQGRSINEARLEFERVLSREPRHFGALWHLAQLAARDGRVDDVDKLTSRMLALQPDVVRTLEVQVLRAAALKNQADLNHLVEGLRDADESLLFGVGWRLAVFARDLDAAERVYALLTDARRGPYARALGHTQLLFIEIARNNNFTVSKRLRELADLRHAGVPIEWLTLLTMIAAGGSPDVKELHALQASLEERVAAESAAPARISHALTALGWTYALRGDSTRAHAVATRIERAKGEKRDVNVGRGATIRALLARQVGDYAGVIAWTDRSLTHRWFGDALVEPLNAYTVNRFIRAEALLALGQRDQADAWFASIGQHDPADLALLAPTLMQRAQIADARRDALAASKLTAQLQALRPKAASFKRTSRRAASAEF